MFENQGHHFCSDDKTLTQLVARQLATMKVPTTQVPAIIKIMHDLIHPYQMLRMHVSMLMATSQVGEAIPPIIRPRWPPRIDGNAILKATEAGFEDILSFARTMEGQEHGEAIKILKAIKQLVSGLCVSANQNRALWSENVRNQHLAESRRNFLSAAKMFGAVCWGVLKELKFRAGKRKSDDVAEE